MLVNRGSRGTDNGAIGFGLGGYGCWPRNSEDTHSLLSIYLVFEPIRTLKVRKSVLILDHIVIGRFESSRLCYLRVCRIIVINKDLKKLICVKVVIIHSRSRRTRNVLAWNIYFNIKPILFSEHNWFPLYRCRILTRKINNMYTINVIC